jgi:hypothetical protein
MTNITGDVGPQKIARIAGLLYLLYIAIFAFSTFIQGKPVVPGNAAATAKNIVASEWLFRIGFTSEVLAALLFLLTAWSLYVLLKPVGESLALIFLLLNLCGVAVECVTTLIHFAALPLSSGAAYLSALRTDQLQALAMLSLNLSGSGNMITALFYGAWLFPLGYLVIKSNFLPRLLGILLILDGASLWICFFQLCLFPGYEKMTYPLYPVMFIAECGLALWLLIKGVKVQKEPASSPA